MASCGKRSFYTEQLAVEALINVKINFENNTVCNVYHCDDCGSWHLTSKGDMHPDLINANKNKLISKEKEANYWTKKLH